MISVKDKKTIIEHLERKMDSIRFGSKHHVVPSMRNGLKDKVDGYRACIQDLKEKINFNHSGGV